MSMLMQRSGLSRQTIHFYRRKGLLPPANKTSRTYAVYHPDTVELLRIIKECQGQLRISLDEIATLFQEAKYDVPRIAKALENRSAKVPSVSRVLSSVEPGQPQPEDIPAEWLAQVQLSGLLPAARGKKLRPAAESIRSLWELSRFGVNLESLKPLAALIRSQAEAELAEFRAVLASSCRDYSCATQLLSALEDFVRCQRVEALRDAFAAQRLISEDLFIGPNRKHMFPSETLLAKMGLNREIDRLLIHLDEQPDDKVSLVDLSRAYYLRSDWLNLFGVSQKILQLDPTSVRATADLSRAMYYLGRIDESVAMLEQRLRTSNDPLLKFRLGQCLVLQAKSCTMTEFLSAVVRKEQLAGEALREATDAPTRRWIRLDKALDDLTVSDPLHLNLPRSSDLEQLHSEYQSLTEKGLSVLGRMTLARGRILAAYALYLAYLRERHPKTEQLRRKIVQMDPYAALASRSPKVRIAVEAAQPFEQVHLDRLSLSSVALDNANPAHGEFGVDA